MVAMAMEDREVLMEAMEPPNRILSIMTLTLTTITLKITITLDNIKITIIKAAAITITEQMVFRQLLNNKIKEYKLRQHNRKTIIRKIRSKRRKSTIVVVVTVKKIKRKRRLNNSRFKHHLILVWDRISNKIRLHLKLGLRIQV